MFCDQAKEYLSQKAIRFQERDIAQDPGALMATYASPEQIAEVVYEAATDGKDQLRYVAGADAKAMYAMRLQLGEEAFRKAMAQQFFGDAPKAA